MTCPSCRTKIPLTWGKYWGSPLGRHNCPECKGRFKLLITLPYLLCIFIPAVLLGAAGGVFGSSAGASIGATLIATLSIYLAVVLPLDRWYDDTRRKCKPIAVKPLKT